MPVSENEAQLVQAQLAEVGIEVEHRRHVPVEDFGNVLDAGEFELIAFTWIGTPFPFRVRCRSSATAPTATSRTRTSPGFDELIDEIGAARRRRSAPSLANETDVMLWDYVPTLPLYQRPELAAVNANLANFGAFGFRPRAWEDVGWMS